MMLVLPESMSLFTTTLTPIVLALDVDGDSQTYKPKFDSVSVGLVLPIADFFIFILDDVISSNALFLA